MSDGRFKKIPLGDRFYDRIEKDSSGCWLWLGSRGKDGYGRSSINRKGVWAHRVSWVIHYRRIPTGMWVLHKCDNPPCVNPDHLFLGTAKDNNLDKVHKNRQTKGSKVNTSKINEEKVHIIKSMLGKGLSGREIARTLGLKDHHIYDIKNGRSWSWL